MTLCPNNTRIIGIQTQTVWRYRSIRRNNVYQWISLLFRHVDNKTKTIANHKHLHVSWTIRVSKLIGFYIVHQLWVCHLVLAVNLTKSFSFNMFTYLINQYLRFKIGTAFTKRHCLTWGNEICIQPRTQFERNINTAVLLYK